MELINLDEIKEPLIACPNDPDNIKPLSEIAGNKIERINEKNTILTRIEDAILLFEKSNNKRNF